MHVGRIDERDGHARMMKMGWDGLFLYYIHSESACKANGRTLTVTGHADCFR